MKSDGLIFSVLLVLFCILASACGSSKTPDGMPSLIQCTVIITQDGKPLHNANVSFLPEDSSSKWNASGSTDTSGKALMYTWSVHKGVAAGKYKVTVRKVETEKLPPAPSGSTQPSRSPDSFSLIEKQYGNVESTPLMVEIAKGTKEITLDVGEPVKELLKNNLLE